MVNWLRKFIHAPREIGAVAPSSAPLAKLMTRGIRRRMTVLELGPGDGAVTRFILPKLGSPERLTLIESDPELARICTDLFPGVRVITSDVETVLSGSREQYDLVVSGIPFASMESAKRQRVFRLIRDHLASDGKYVMFQYSLLTKDELERLFTRVDIDFTPWNIPPAFVYTCRK